MTIPPFVKYLYQQEHWSPYRIGVLLNRQEIHIENIINNGFPPAKRPRTRSDDPPWLHSKEFDEATDPQVLLTWILKTYGATGHGPRKEN